MLDRPPFDAIVLAGGGASRLGGVAKPLLTLGGSRLVDRVLRAAAAAHRRVVVGPDPRTAAADVVTREQPPGGGPVAGLVAGLAHVDCPAVVVLAADLPFLTTETVDLLRSTLAGADDRQPPDAAVLVDDSGHEQYLIAAWRTERLRDIVSGHGQPGGSMRAVLAQAVRPARVPAARGEGAPPPWLDCDTEEDLARARRWV